MVRGEAGEDDRVDAVAAIPAAVQVLVEHPARKGPAELLIPAVANDAERSADSSGHLTVDGEPVSRWGGLVDQAEDLEEALQFVHRCRVIVDPQVHGIAIARRAHEHRSGLPTTTITARRITRAEDPHESISQLLPLL